MVSKKRPIAKQMPKRFANEKYGLACSQPYLWMLKAQEIRRAADVLWKQFVDEITAFSNGNDSPAPSFGCTAMILYGLVVENLLKDGLSSKGLAVSSSGNFDQKSHALDDLAHNLGLVLTDAETELVERLQHFVEWAGRYPIPLHRDGLYPRELLDGSKGVLYGISTGDDKQIVHLLKKIQDCLPTTEVALEKYVSEATAPAAKVG